MDQPNVKKLLYKLEVGKEIKLVSEDLPRVVQMIQPVGKPGEEGYQAGHEGEVSKIKLNSPMTVTVVALNKAPGKTVGVKLALLPKDTRWYDAHSCDGATDNGFGWWITPEDVAQANPELLKTE